MSILRLSFWRLDGLYVGLLDTHFDELWLVFGIRLVVAKIARVRKGYGREWRREQSWGSIVVAYEGVLRVAEKRVAGKDVSWNKRGEMTSVPAQGLWVLSQHDRFVREAETT